MKGIVFIAIASLVSATACGYPEYAKEGHQSDPHGSQYHEGHLYHGLSHRSVMYFAPTKDVLVDEFLLGTLINECALEERDVVTMVMTKDGFSSPGWVKDTFDYSKLVKMYDIKEGDHKAILIGKDGTEKLRWGPTTNWIEIKDTIDAMPMRQAEMKRAASRCSI
ncbi:DUF4174 domain-containing protein [Vibrio maritimus]|uniref:DUF4174 domain-containing protein n=1 Tax=Vibrio variabilis TaxID=990271 RepID=A0ABQ0JM91_9VIBR|nr:MULTISPECIES: DUF4174 domain-containing protein [Vibrio]USD63750.1 DUF4174 domain-containing protein [Vibrio sp. SCSIO 43140]GAL29866.1 hypothetical protein JCM19239_5680 [Vibrio variabilis]